MQPDYDDVKSRIPESPKWYTEEGFPRYDDFELTMCNIYARYGILYSIFCQSCNEKFIIGRAFGGSLDRYEVAIDTSKFPPSKYTVYDKPYIWVSMRQAIFATPYFIDPDDEKSCYREITIDNIVEGLSYGDPPSHGCPGGGETMGSINGYTIEVWDSRIDEVIEDGYIKEFGHGGRLPQFEGIDLDPDWPKPGINN